VLAAPPPVAWAASHAALPVVAEDGAGRLRLYFSSRDGGGRSHIGCADLELGEREASAVPRPEPVLRPGALGAFDDSGVTGACLVRHEDREYLYYSGWSLGVTVPFYFFVGCAVSGDGGQSFERVSTAPVLERDAVDPYLTASPWIVVEDGRWRMWYVSGTGWDVVDGRPRHRYHVKYAESADGLVWERGGHVCIDYAGAHEYAVGRPCVVRDGGLYRMWYSVRGAAYRIGYAESGDGLTWERKDDEAGIDVSTSGWDSEMQAYPIVVDRGGTRFLLYNGNGYGATGIGYAVERSDEDLRGVRDAV
jgi:hypothetical protein